MCAPGLSTIVKILAFARVLIVAFPQKKWVITVQNAAKTVLVD